MLMVLQASAWRLAAHIRTLACLAAALVLAAGLAAPAAAQAPADAPAGPFASTRPFFVFFATHPTQGCDVWQSDGTGTGARRIFDLVNDYDACGIVIQMAGLRGGTIAVIEDADDASLTRPGLYRLRPGLPPVRMLSRALADVRYLRLMAVHDGQALILTTHDYGRPSLYITDGTTAGTRRVINFDRPNSTIGFHGVTAIFRHRGRWLMMTNEYIQDTRGTYGRVWRLNLTTGSWSRLFDFRPDGGRFWGQAEAMRGAGRIVATVGPNHERFVFWRQVPNMGAELFVSDGTRTGTRLLREFWTGPDHGFGGVAQVVPFGNRALLVANTPLRGDELWITDGTDTGTRLVADINPGIEGSGIRLDQMVIHDGRAYFMASSRGMRTPWVTDGTREGTRPVATTFRGLPLTLLNDGPNPMAFVAGRLHFRAVTRQGVCPSSNWPGDPDYCRYEESIFRWDPATDQLIQAVQTSRYSCDFRNAYVGFRYTGGFYSDLMAYGIRLLMSATSRAPVSPVPACGSVETDIEPHVLRNRDASVVRDIAPGLRSSNPQFIGSSLCDGRC